MKIDYGQSATPNFTVSNEFERYCSGLNTPTRYLSSINTDSDSSFYNLNNKIDRESLCGNSGSASSLKMKHPQSISAFREIIPQFDEFQFNIGRPKRSFSIDLTSKIASRLAGYFFSSIFLIIWDEV